MKYLIYIFIASLLAGTASAEMPQFQSSSHGDTASVMAAPIRFFQNFLSRADGDRCPMTPSCSSYAIQAIERHGAIKGWIMASDRLMRCGHDELTLSPSVMTRKGLRCQDSVQSNDFWSH